MADVFISYKREERDKAEAIAEAIGKRGYSVWWDVELLPGGRWSEEIEAVLCNAKAAIVLWSAESVESDWVLEEAEEARKRDIIVPVLLEPIAPPFGFRKIHACDLTGWNGSADDATLDVLLAAVEGKAGPPPKPRKPAVEAKQEYNFEAEFWRSVASAEPQSAAEYEFYLKRFGPEGQFAELARIRIERLHAEADAAAQPAPPAEPAPAPAPAAPKPKPAPAAPVTPRAAESAAAPRAAGQAGMAEPHVPADALTNALKSRGPVLVAGALLIGLFVTAIVVRQQDASRDTGPSLALSDYVPSDYVPDPALNPEWNLESPDSGGESGTDGSACESSAECYDLGVDYLRGRGVARDPARSAGYFQKACDAGNATGCAHLGNQYKDGDGVDQDYVRAVALFRKACDGGDATGCNNLAYRYQYAQGVEQDYALAAELYQEACDGGQDVGCNQLGNLYKNGQGVAQDHARANALYRQACDNGEATGCTNLGNQYKDGQGVARDYSRAAELFRQACDDGEETGCNNLGYRYEVGEGVAQDHAQAAELYRKSCDGGEMVGCSNLGNLYRDGEGVARDQGRANKLYRQACDGGYESACSRVN